MNSKTASEIALVFEVVSIQLQYLCMRMTHKNILSELRLEIHSADTKGLESMLVLKFI